MMEVVKVVFSLFFLIALEVKCIRHNNTEMTLTATDTEKIIPRNSIQPTEKFNLKLFWNRSELTNDTFSGRSSSACPEEFSWVYWYFSTCYIITEPQPFPPKCPYPNFLSVEYFYYAIELPSHPYWLMAQRNTTDGFGPFEWTEQSSLYGIPFSYGYEHVDNFLDKNCMVIENNKAVPISCSHPHRHICVYPYELMNKYCKTHYQHSKDYNGMCIPNSIDIENHRCYCGKKMKGTRHMFCDALAEPLSEYQNSFLLKQFEPQSTICWFGLYKAENGDLRWETANTEVNYTFLSKSADMSKKFGAIQYDHNPHWILTEDDGSVSCGICEITNAYDKKVSLQLNYISSSNKVELLIKNPLELSDRYGDHYALYCFVGPTRKFFREMVKRFENFEVQAETEEVVAHFDNDWDFPVYYWCEGFQHPNFAPVYSDKILVHDRRKWHEYAIHVSVRAYNRDPFLDNLHLHAREYILYISELPDTLRVMKVVKFDQKNSLMQMILHLTMEWNKNDENEFEYLENLLTDIFLGDDFILNVTRFGRTDVCMPSVTNSNGKTLHWPKTSTGTTAQPIESCLRENGDPVTRKCEGDFLHGGFWSEVVGTCTEAVEVPGRTQELEDLLNNENITSDELSEKLSHITQDNTNVTVEEIYLMSEILKKLETFQDQVNTTDVVTIISNIMNFEANELKRAQEELNCTDKFLHSLDNILANVKVYGNDNHKIVVSQKVLVQINTVIESNITGIALQKNSDDDSFNNFTLIPVYRNTSLKLLLRDNIELAAFLSNNLIGEIQNCTNANNSIKLVMALFYSDVLFNENVEGFRQTNSRILSVLIPDLHCAFSTPIPVILKPLNDTNLRKKCSYWNYGLDENTGHYIKGQWAEDGILKTKISNNSHVMCEFDHLTHFGLLMMGRSNEDEMSEDHTKALNVITAIGTTSSLASILGMFIIAMIYKNWRESCSSKILLNFSVAVALQMILLYVANNIKTDGIWCTIAGIGLHYTLLSEFCWMLVIAILQYRRFVIVFQKQISRLVAKSCLFCWCLPLLPILALVVATNDSYKKNSQGLCYPSQGYFYFGVILPVFVLMLTNFLIFIRIMFAVCHKKVKAYGGKKSEIKLQIVLAVFLFFLLGLSWLFGLAVGFGMGIVFIYLFCLTSTFQGVVLFLFFAVMSENSRKLWMSIKRSLGCGSHNRRVSKNNFSSTENMVATETSFSGRIH